MLRASERIRLTVRSIVMLAREQIDRPNDQRDELQADVLPQDRSTVALS